MNWIAFNDINQIDSIINESENKPVLIFKHSTRCIISKMALRNFEAEYNFGDAFISYYLDLIAYREISNEVSSRFNVTHQSPQLLVIKDGKVVYTESHEGIDVGELTAYSNL